MAKTIESARIQALRAAPLDAWVALTADEARVVATGVSYEEVVKKSDEAGIVDPVLVKTPKSWEPLSV